MKIVTKGTVCWFNDARGFGFISTDTGQDVFVHYRDLQEQASERKTLKENDRVNLIIIESTRGLKAEKVSLISPETEKA